MKIRIAVAVDKNGDWSAFGNSWDTDEQNMQNAKSWRMQNPVLRWVEAEVTDFQPIPVIQGTVSKEGENG